MKILHVLGVIGLQSPKIKLLLVFSIVVFVSITTLGSSQAALPNVIYMAGTLTDSVGETIHMKAHVINNAAGTSNILVGYGMLGQINNNNSSQFDRFYVQSNMFSNDLVVFTGNVTKSTDPNMIGSPIVIKVDPSTGNTTLVFGYSNYTG
ncbi:MAG: hypothetical protein ACREBA_04980, partial [Nitrosotalea sp.]